MDKPPVLRVTRPTDHLSVLKKMYSNGLGFQILSEFADHDGFDGIILGHPKWPYHIEFTSKKGHPAGLAPDRDHLLVFYIPVKQEWTELCGQMKAAGFVEVSSFNPYWDVNGKTFEDVDGYRVVLQNELWPK